MGTDYTLAGLRFILAPPTHTHSVDEQKSEVGAEVVPKVSPAITTHTHVRWCSRRGTPDLQVPSGDFQQRSFQSQGASAAPAQTLR